MAFDKWTLRHKKLRVSRGGSYPSKLQLIEWWSLLSELNLIYSLLYGYPRIL